MGHPIGPVDGTINEKIARLDSVARANEWMRFLVTYTKWAIVAPALTYVTALDIDMHGPRALTMQRLVMERCDFVVHVGGWLSPHMVLERNWAANLNIPIVDLTFMGAHPPWKLDKASDAIVEHSRFVQSIRPKAPWMIPLATEDVLALRKAEEVLVDDPKRTDALAVIRAIIHAAQRR